VKRASFSVTAARERIAREGATVKAAALSARALCATVLADKRKSTTRRYLMALTRSNSAEQGSDPQAVRVRLDETYERHMAGAIEEKREDGSEEYGVPSGAQLTIAHDYDTVDRDLERLGMTVSRIPVEAGVIWRLQLPRGERVEACEPGNNGLAPPAEVARLIEGVIAEKQLIPMPPLSTDRGAMRLREMIETQRLALLTNDPGSRLGTDPENLHQHRVAARRTTAFLRATRAYIDPAWRRSLAEPLRKLGEATGPVRDLDVLLGHVQDELGGLEEVDREGADVLIARLESERVAAGRALLDALNGDYYSVLLTRLRLPPRLAPAVGTVPLKRIARKEFRRLVKSVDQLGKHPDDDALHALRITLKRARYAAELSAPSGEDGARFLTAAKMLQDLLGEHQDAVVAEQRLRATTVIDPPTAAAFVAGRMTERQRARRERVAERLPVAWKRLRKSGARLR